MKKILFFILLISYIRGAYAQFAPQVGQPGCDAVHKSSASIKAWASGCKVKRGYINIANPSLGIVTTGDSSLAAGPADNTIVSLGDSGVATLTFPVDISNGPGADFAVFENGFSNPLNAAEAFLELAFVEVSSDGEHFFRFPPVSYVPRTTQIPGAGVYMDAANLYNLAGKYVAGYGTPFDLDNLAGFLGLDVQHVTHVRIIDVIGDIGAYGSKDNNGNKINDPYPTDFATGGFDLDAVAVLNHSGTSVDEHLSFSGIHLYPNPATGRVFVGSDGSFGRLSLGLVDITGNILYSSWFDKETTLDIGNWPAGIYFVIVKDENGNQWRQRLSKL